MIDQIADKNWLLGLSIAVFIESRAREIPKRVVQPSVLQTLNGHVDAVRALWFPPDFSCSFL
jgi:hypothetical protein